MSQKIVSNYGGSFIGDETLEQQGSILAAVIAKVIEEAEALGGADQQIERVTFEFDDSMQFHGGSLRTGQQFTLQIVSRLL